MTLADIKAGQSAVIQSLQADATIRTKLLDLGLLPGTALTLKRNLGWSKTLHVNVRHSNLIVRESLAKQIKVALTSEH